MKKIKKIIVLLLTLIIALTFFGCGDFIPPNEFKELYPDLWKGPKDDDGREGYVDRVWEKTLEELIDYLYEKGAIETKNTQILASGIASEGYVLDGKMDILYWDLDALPKNSDEYKHYDNLVKDGYTIIYNVSVYSPVLRGPFGIWVKPTADVEGIQEIFKDFGWEPIEEE